MNFVDHDWRDKTLFATVSLLRTWNLLWRGYMSVLAFKLAWQLPRQQLLLWFAIICEFWPDPELLNQIRIGIQIRGGNFFLLNTMKILQYVTYTGSHRSKSLVINLKLVPLFHQLMHFLILKKYIFLHERIWNQIRNVPKTGSVFRTNRTSGSTTPATPPNFKKIINLILLTNSVNYTWPHNVQCILKNLLPPHPSREGDGHQPIPSWEGKIWTRVSPIFASKRI